MARIVNNWTGEFYISDNWYIEDILSRDETLTEYDAKEIMQNIVNNFDASIGINWEVIDYHIQKYYESFSS